MTGKRAKTCIIEDKSPIEVRRKTAEMLVFGELACLGAFLRGTLAILMTRHLDFEALILV
jgi:hypothetical protein